MNISARVVDERDAGVRSRPLRPRRDGWTAEKQRRFIAALAETGVVRRSGGGERALGQPARAAARRSRIRDAWDAALRMAARPAAAKLYEYALGGMTETVWRDGDVVYKRRRASEKALIFLLSPRSDALRPPAAAAPAADTEGAPLDMLAETAALFDLFLDNLARPPAGGADEEEGEAGEAGADTPPPEPDRG